MKKLLTMIGAAAVAAALPLQAEVHSLRPYAYVQSYGCNGVDTGYYAKDTTKFVIDFEFTDVSDKSWLMGAGKNIYKQCHAIYLNGKQQLAWTTRGEHWTATWDSSSTQIAGSSILNPRLVQTIASAGDEKVAVKTTLRYFDGSAADDKDWRLSGSATLTSTGPSDITTYLFSANGNLEGSDSVKPKAKIYSFEADDNCTSGVPAVFLAPAENDGAAVFVNVIDGTFHGEIYDTATTALSYSDGIGNAGDYKWKDSVFSAKFYAYSEDSEKGLVKFGADAASDETSAWIVRGESATLTAVPADGYVFTGWKGDTRSITTPGTAADATVTVQSDRAAQLLATFARTTARRAFDTGDYAQSGEEALLIQLDGIRNAEGGAHATAPATWCDLASGIAVTANGSPSFSSDAWAANGKSSFNFTSDAVTNAFAKKSFTLEMFISHPAISSNNDYAYWIYSGNPDNRQLTAELRWRNSHNPLIEGVQWGESTWANRSAFANGSITAWNTRQHIAIVCDETGATTYCNGRKIHHTDGGSLEPTMNTISIGADYNGEYQIRNGAEICAVRMTARVLSVDEIKYNAAIDARRFVDGGAAAAGETANVFVESSSAMDPLAALEADLSGRFIAAAGDVFTAPAVASVGGYYYTLGGYTLETWDSANNTWGAAVAHDGNTYTATGSGIVRVTWQWTLTLRGAAAYDVDDYVQDGLVAHFDGIRNAGADAAHASSGTTWVNLADGENNATINGSGSWTGDGLGYNFTAASDSDYAITDSGIGLGAYATIQISCDIDYRKQTSDNKCYPSVFNDADNDCAIFFRNNKTRSTGLEFNADDQYGTGTGESNRPKFAGWGGEYVTAVLGVGNAYLFEGTTLENEKARRSDDGSSYTNKLTWGGCPTSGYHFSVTGTYYSVRAYNRALSEAELAQNRRVDEIRFHGNGDVTVVNGTIGDTGANGESSLTDGVYNIEAGTWTITAPEVRSDGRTYQPKLLVEMYNATTSEWEATTATPQWANSYTVDKATLGNGRIRLTWTWQIRPGLIISFH